MQKRNQNVSFTTNLTDFVGLYKMNNITYGNDTELKKDTLQFKTEWVNWMENLKNNSFFTTFRKNDHSRQIDTNDLSVDISNLFDDNMHEFFQ